MNEHQQTAALVLAKCAANDPWFPNGGEAIVMAWAEVFAESGLAREELLAGVARAYRLETEGFKPLAASIVKHSFAAYHDSLKSLSDEKRESMKLGFKTGANSASLNAKRLEGNNAERRTQRASNAIKG